MLLALKVTILLLAPPFAQLVLTDALPALLTLIVLNVRQTSMEVAPVLPVLLAHSPLLDQLP